MPIDFAENKEYASELRALSEKKRVGYQHPRKTFMDLSDKEKHLLGEAYDQTFREAQSNAGFFKRMGYDVTSAMDSFTSCETRTGVAVKAGAVGLGVVMMPQGLYHLISGAQERGNQMLGADINLWRVFAGAVEAGTGAAMLYYGLARGHSPSRMGFNRLQETQRGEIGFLL